MMAGRSIGMSRFHLSLGLVMLLGIAKPPCAIGQSSPNPGVTYQTVRLPDGAIYQGELVELVPGDHLTLRLATGEIKRFSWAEIQISASPGTVVVPGVVPGAIPSVIPGLLAGSLLPPALPPPGPEDLVQLHFQSTDPAAILFGARATGNIRFNNPGSNYESIFQDWAMICPRAPCDVRADRRQVYSIQGPYIIRSLPVTLPLGNSVTMEARVAHQGTRTLFTWMSVLGAVSAITGLSLLIAGAVQDTTAIGTDPMSLAMQQTALNNQQTYYLAGGVLLGVGSALLISGIIASVYTRTTIAFTSDGHVALRLPGKSRLDLQAGQVRF
jgi:hypothetical protein